MTSTEIYNAIISKENESMGSQVKNLSSLFVEFYQDLVSKVNTANSGTLLKSAHYTWANVADSLNKRYPTKEKYPQNLFEVIAITYTTAFDPLFKKYGRDTKIPSLEKLPALLFCFIKVCKDIERNEK